MRIAFRIYRGPGAILPAAGSGSTASEPCVDPTLTWRRSCGCASRSHTMRRIVLPARGRIGERHRKVGDSPVTTRESSLGSPAGGIASVPPWLPSAPPPRLEASEVDVWRASLDHGPACHEELWSLLAPDECDRAGRFHFERDRRRFVAGRGLLRVILS